RVELRAPADEVGGGQGAPVERLISAERLLVERPSQDEVAVALDTGFAYGSERRGDRDRVDRGLGVVDVSERDASEVDHVHAIGGTPARPAEALASLRDRHPGSAGDPGDAERAHVPREPNPLRYSRNDAAGLMVDDDLHVVHV